MENEIEIKRSSNSLHYVAYTLLIAISLVLTYFVFTPTKQQTSIEKEVAELSFEDLPYSTKIKYTTEEEFSKLQSKLNTLLKEKESFLQEISLLQEQLNANSTQNSLDEELIKNEEDNLIATKEPEIKKQTTAALIENANIAFENRALKRIKEFAKCYDMDIGKYNITKSCKDSIVAFVNRHKNASYFEIIAIVDETEFTLYKNLENNKFIYDRLKTTQDSINTMKKLSQAGLAKYRAIEANWVIKSHLGRDAKVYNANYKLLSNDGKKGFVIRAYE